MEGALEGFRDALVAEGKSPATVRAYLADARGWLAEGGGGAEEMADHLARLGLAGRSRGTLARKAASLRRFGRFLVDRGLSQEDPSRLLESPRRRERLPVHLVPRQVDALLDSPPSDTQEGVRDRAILQLLYDAGLRASEALGLGLVDVDLSTGEARVTGKGGRERLAYVGPRGLERLAAWVEGPRRDLAPAGESALFVSTRGKPLGDRALRRLVAGHAKAAGLPPGVSPHALRHAFATHLLQAGCDVRLVQRLLGHRRISTTQVYTHLAFPDLVMTYRACHPRA